jgi:hypothetical protein
MVTYVAMLMWRLIVKLNYASPDWDSSPMLVVGQSGRQHYTDLEKYDGSVITGIGWLGFCGQVSNKPRLWFSPSKIHTQSLASED